MVKVKQNRIYDKHGFRKRAACLCVRDTEESEVSNKYCFYYIFLIVVLFALTDSFGDQQPVR